MTFTQLNARLENFLNGWLLVLVLKECLVECATSCVKSEVILKKMVDNTKIDRPCGILHKPYYSSCHLFCLTSTPTRTKIEAD